MDQIVAHSYKNRMTSHTEPQKVRTEITLSWTYFFHLLESIREKFVLKQHFGLRDINEWLLLLTGRPILYTGVIFLALTNYNRTKTSNIVGCASIKKDVRSEAEFYFNRSNS